MAGTSISFNSNSLQTNNIFTESIDHETAAEKAMNVIAIAHANASVIPFVSYPSRTITISGTVIGSGVVDLDSKLDTFRGYLIGNNKNLDIGYNASTRRYIATPVRIRIDRPGGLAYAKFEVEFTTTDPFGRDTSTTPAASATGATTQPRADAHTFLGTAPWLQPVATVTLTAVTGATSKYIKFGNSATGQEITITRTWANGDVLEIDCANKTVKVNGTEVAFTGAFPEFAPGAGTINYSDSFTTRTFNYSVVYYARYM